MFAEREAMRHSASALAFVLFLTAAGCVSPNDAPSWQRPGLAGGKIGAAMSNAIKQTDDEMTMSCDRPEGERQTEPRPIARPTD